MYSIDAFPNAQKRKDIVTQVFVVDSSMSMFLLTNLTLSKSTIQDTNESKQDLKADNSELNQLEVSSRKTCYTTGHKRC